MWQEGKVEKGLKCYIITPHSKSTLYLPFISESDNADEIRKKLLHMLMQLSVLFPFEDERTEQM